MDNTDTRTLNQETQFHLRKQIVRLRTKGVSNKDVAAITGTSASHCSRIWSSYKNDGADTILPGKRGRRKGEKRVLDADQEKEIQKIIIDKTPDQMKFSFMLWTREAVRQLIKFKYHIDIPLRSISRYLERWNFTAQRPLKRAYEQDPKRVEKWMKEEYPVIKERASKENAEIFWGDETGIQNGASYSRGFAPAGQTPVLALAAKKSRINMISAISNRGSSRFMIYEDTMDSGRLIDFMKRLIKGQERKVFLILDNLRVHHSKAVTSWIEENRDKIELFYLPPYAPERNPDEYLNNELKHSVHSGLHPKTKDDIVGKVRSFMMRLKKRPHHVKSYFRHKKLAYVV